VGGLISPYTLSLSNLKMVVSMLITVGLGYRKGGPHITNVDNMAGYGFGGGAGWGDGVGYGDRLGIGDGYEWGTFGEKRYRRF
jgi:hypothetical protein